MAKVWGRGAARRNPASGEIGFGMVGHLGWLVILREGILAILCLERIYMYGSVGGLGCNVLVEGIPGDSLDVVAVLGNLTD
jgi:hypothetical protein